MNASSNNHLDSIFLSCGFSKIQSDGIHFTLTAQQGEIDCIYVYQNLIVLCEETTGKDSASKHLPKKKLFHQAIRKSYDEFLEVYGSKNKEFKKFLDESEFHKDDLEFRHLYYSSVKDIDDSQSLEPFSLMSRESFRYFESTVKSIEKSARFEVFKFLKIELKDIGRNKIAGRPNNRAHHYFDAFILSGKQSNYPEGFYVASFYADPESLISRSYVLRREGWVHPDISYQRVIKGTKLQEMRNHLSSDKKVYVNNVIVTLPSNTMVHKSIDGRDETVDLSTITEVINAKISLPEELGTVGIIDGQHRIFSYYEGNDEFDKTVRKIRPRQNLLVTGIIFPKDYNEEKRVRFEAELFLKINGTQSRVPKELRQDIELIVEPLSPAAIAKSIIERLATKGALKNQLRKSSFDASNKVRTSSIVDFGLVPVACLESKGANSLFKLWKSYKHEDVTEENLNDYIEFCTSELNEILHGVRENIDGKLWVAKAGRNQGLLSPTFINGMIICLRHAIEDGYVRVSADGTITKPDYNRSFKDIDIEMIREHTSSTWAKLGKSIYESHIDVPKEEDAEEK
ncbi:DGQHR domain-containing protein [Halomonas sp. DP5Y7-2]|uniref:DGQHR domain-containing protein n=1 Tax=Halomonas sp. DP5Y7-2 TaxID=2859076 RepID=UPI001C9925A7|nr:DGQHR domain-containing protein [Halomonas sp. DP5Y7-2]MBY5984413.1 DGQHR domain-containing protein [Halomonas sp. DP5Y7-2]